MLAPTTSRPALASAPASVGRRYPHSRCLYLRPTCASGSARAAARVTAARDRQQPRLVAVQSPPPLAAGVVPRDAETGLAILLVVLAMVMSFSLSLIILLLSARKVLQKLEITAKRIAKIVAEELPGTLSSLKLSFLEINDLTSQLTNFRKMLSRFRKETTKESFQTGQT